MRQLDELRQAWTIFDQYSSVDDLRNAIRLESSSSDDKLVLRSLYWKVFLLFESIDHQIWQSSLTAAHIAYDALHARFSKQLEAKQIHDDPLADGVEDHWLAVQEDETLKAEILQDIVRLPDDEYLRRPDTQQIMSSILFVYCKLNPDLSYRQGMHEILASILIAVERDALQPDDRNKLDSNDGMTAILFDANHIEHDAFILFSRVMQNAKNFYEHTNHHAAENPLVLQSNRITGEILKQADAQLAHHLEKLGIPPQLYLMRWIRLLFGREFDRADLPGMWDIIFAEDNTLEIVDYICVVMLLRIRWDLLEADYNTALSLLLRYSTAGQVRAKTIAIDALHLRDRLTPATGRRLIAKYTGRSPEQANGGSMTPPAMQRNITAVSGVNALKSAFRGTRPQPTSNVDSDQVSSLEALLQNTARNIYSKGEQLGIGKAVRNAVDDIHRRAQQVRDVEPPSPRLTSPRLRPSTRTRFAELEERNKHLAKILEQSTACLWDLQKHLAEAEGNEVDGSPGVDLEEMSIAIGKVQFVQLHLQDSSLKLEQRTLVTTSAEDTEHAGMLAPDSTSANLAEPNQKMRSSSREDVKTDARDLATTAQDQERGNAIDSPQPHVAPSANDLNPPQPARPLLAESSYSWMLGQGEEQPVTRRRERPDTLFGS